MYWLFGGNEDVDSDSYSHDVRKPSKLSSKCRLLVYTEDNIYIVKLYRAANLAKWDSYDIKALGLECSCTLFF